MMMAEKGLVPDSYSYTILVDELCKQKRLKEAALAEMLSLGLTPGPCHLHCFDFWVHETR